MTERIILIRFVGGPIDGTTEELTINGEPPFHVVRRLPAPISFTAPDPGDLSAPQNIHEYQLRGGPGLVGRGGDGAWLYDYKGDR